MINITNKIREMYIINILKYFLQTVIKLSLLINIFKQYSMSIVHNGNFLIALMEFKMWISLYLWIALILALYKTRWNSTNFEEGRKRTVRKNL